MRKKSIIALLCIFLFFLIPTSAQKIGHITLLAVSEATQTGSTADLYLRIQEGSGGVYIDTFPLTKLDTQLSTRFAQQIACDFVDKECTDKDFFYTIRSDATIIGGPSAGAALATLTIAMLDDLKINESVAITGTINVGGLIGPVGSLIGKIDAAKEAGMTKVLIPRGSRYEEKPEHSYNERLANMSAEFYRINNETNATEVDLFMYGEIIGVEVKEVGTVQEAVYEITGKWYDANEEEIIPNEWYVEKMKEIANDLCNRTQTIIEEYEAVKESHPTAENAEKRNQTEQLYEEVLNTTIRAENATAYGIYYVAASTCFGNNIRISYATLTETGIDKNRTKEEAGKINSSINEINYILESKELETITDLQTYLVVNERLEEAKDTLQQIYINLAIDLGNESAYDIAYATERLYSAHAWASFFKNEGKKLELDNEAVRETCIQKIGEAEERYQYVKLLTTEPLENIVTYMDRANEEYEKGNYVLCLDIASRAKANLDIILSLLGVRDESQLTELVEERLKLVRQVINKQQEKGYFPMLGYSYYEYASFLKESDPYSALIYAHYALEFSHLDMYFKEKKIDIPLPEIENILYFLFGLGTGFLIASVTILRKGKKNKEKNKSTNMPK